MGFYKTTEFQLERIFDKGPALEPAAFESLHSGQFTLPTQLIKQDFLNIYKFIPVSKILLNCSRLVQSEIFKRVLSLTVL